MTPGMRLDTGLLRESSADFAVVADTHYMSGGVPHAGEYASRARQNDRISRALELIGADEVAFAVHLGDHVQDYPGNPTFEQSMSGALAQLEAECAVPIYHVAGNTDVGDKCDPISPGIDVSPESLRGYHSDVGPSWYDVRTHGLHLIVANSSLLGSGLAEEQSQRAWLEEVLRGPRHGRRMLFLHYPLFLRSLDDPGLGNYDVVDPPARAWLAGLIEEHDLEVVFAGHSHFAFLNRRGDTRFFVTPSTSFTRPGFSEMFSAPAPPEHGRDDAAKLGFYLVRVHEDGVAVHLIRTLTDQPDVAGDKPVAAAAQPRGQLVTGIPGDLPAGRLGVMLRHPLATLTDVPVAFPSALRQPVRNDYPLLACLELGARHVQLPASEFDDQVLGDRVALLRDEGVHVVASQIWRDDAALALGDVAPRVDTILLQTPGPAAPSAECLAAIDRIRSESGAQVALGRIAADDHQPGRELPRIRHGYHLDELTELATSLEAAGTAVDATACVAPAGQVDAWIALLRSSAGVNPVLGTLDITVPVAPAGDLGAAAHIAEVAVLTAPISGIRLTLDPLIELDRTLDTSDGLLDRLCNPRAAFHVARCANTVVHAGAPDWTQCRRLEHSRLRLWRLTGPQRVVVLATVAAGVTEAVPLRIGPDADLGDAKSVDLATGFQTSAGSGDTLQVTPERPVLVWTASR